MKKQYIKPVTEGVNVALYGSVLDAPDMPWVPGSPVTEVIDEKENNLLFEDDMWESDPWADNGADDSYDLWKE